MQFKYLAFLLFLTSCMTQPTLFPSSKEKDPMTSEVTCTFQITNWDEKTYQDIGGGAKLTNAKVTQTYSGAIDGTSTIDYLMSYTVQGTASFVGLERFSGMVEDAEGTMVIQHSGSFSDGKALSSWSVIPGSGTGTLARLRGHGSYVAGHGEPAQVSFTGYLDPNA